MCGYNKEMFSTRVWARQSYERYTHLPGNICLDLCPLLFFTFEDGCGVAWNVFNSVEGDIAPGMRGGVRVGAIGGHLEVAFGRVLEGRGELVLGRGNGGHEGERMRGD